MHIEDGLDKLLLGQYDEALAVFAECRTLPQAEVLYQVTLMLIELMAYANNLSKFNLSVQIPSPSNYLAINLKNMHSKLKRLARQLLMITTGYPVPTIDYMGDLSEELDCLVSQALLRKTQIEYDRDHDIETGLLNRRTFIRKVYDILQMQPNKVGILMCCKLANIKYINDTHGYECGDLCIGKVVEVLRSREKYFNLPARVCGNEFAMYAHGFENEDDASEFAQDIFKAFFNARVVLPHEEIKIRVSCGVALYPHDAITSDVLMSYASHAMFEVHSLDRGTIMRFQPEIYRTKIEFLSRQERLNELIEEKLIHFAFQPIVNLRDAKIIGYEALMRPKTDVFTGPLDILSLAEAQSKLRQIERLTFEMIFEWMSSNIERLGDRKIFFNTISMQYMDAIELRNIHPQYDIISKNMVFEILETATIESMLLQRVNRFRKEMPALIAIDDFGCGHSNALRLISISPDILKIDRFFINSIDSAPVTKKELLSNILAYCHAKQIMTIAEGVETYEELASVMRMGFDYAQGFYISRPEFDLVEIDPRVQVEIADLALQINSIK